MKQTTIVAIILGVLVLISALQAFQLNNLKENVETGGLKMGSGSSVATPLSSGGDSDKSVQSLPSSVKNLPKMVGGC